MVESFRNGHEHYAQSTAGARATQIHRLGPDRSRHHIRLVLGGCSDWSRSTGTSPLHPASRPRSSTACSRSSAWVRVPIVATTASTVTDPDTLFAHVCKAREEDFSCVRDEMVSGVTGMAVPIRDSAEGVIGSIIIAGPTERMAAEEQELRAAMLATARATSRSIGHNAGTAAGK